jgi:hypothetical protein
VVLVRPFQVDPAPYLFGGAELFGYAALQVALPDGAGTALVAPAVRFMPFARLAPQAEGQDAWALPGLGEKAQPLRTGGSREADGKRVVLRLALAPDGTLSGKGEETVRGIEAAFLKMQLEKLSEEQRRQALEAAIARTFDNGTLTELAIEEGQQSGAPVVLRFSFLGAGLRARGGRQARAARHLPLKLRAALPAPVRAQDDAADGQPREAGALGGPGAAAGDRPRGRAAGGEDRDALRPLRAHREGRAGAVPGGGDRDALAGAHHAEQYRPFGEFLLASDRAEQRKLVLTRTPAAVARR